MTLAHVISLTTHFDGDGISNWKIDGSFYFAFKWLTRNTPKDTGFAVLYQPFSVIKRHAGGNARTGWAAVNLTFGKNA